MSCQGKAEGRRTSLCTTLQLLQKRWEGTRPNTWGPQEGIKSSPRGTKQHLLADITGTGTYKTKQATYVLSGSEQDLCWSHCHLTLLNETRARGELHTWRPLARSRKQTQDLLAVKSANHSMIRGQQTKTRKLQTIHGHFPSQDNKDTWV